MSPDILQNRKSWESEDGKLFVIPLTGMLNKKTNRYDMYKELLE